MIDDMRKLLIVSSVRWNYLWQRHQALARAAAEEGWHVDFLQPRPRNLHQLASYPTRMLRRERLEQPSVEVRGVVVRKLRDWVLLRGSYDLAVVYLPDRITEILLRRVSVERLVYDAVLDWATVPEGWFPPWGWAAAERRIAALPNASVTTDSEGMRDVLAARGISARVVHPAADSEFLGIAGQYPYSRRQDRILYFGSVRAEVDTQWLAHAALAGFAVDVIGSVDEKAAAADLSRAGITVHSPLTINELPSAVASYKILALPYRGARSATILPAKYWNCLASGAWVLTSGLSAEAGYCGCVIPVTDWNFKEAETVRQLLTRKPQVTEEPPSWRTRWLEMQAASGAM